MERDPAKKTPPGTLKLSYPLPWHQSISHTSRTIMMTMTRIPSSSSTFLS
jgi:hypothetical protein